MTAASSNSEHLGHPLLPATNAGSPLLFSVPGDGPPFSPSSSRKPRNVFSILLPLSSHPSFQQDLTGMVRPCRSLSSASVPLYYKIRSLLPFDPKKVDKAAHVEKQLASYKAPCRGCSKKVLAGLLAGAWGNQVQATPQSC